MSIGPFRKYIRTLVIAKAYDGVSETKKDQSSSSLTVPESQNEAGD